MAESDVVGAVIVSFGAPSRAIACARSVLAGAVRPEYVVVVNNGPSSWTLPEVVALGAVHLGDGSAKAVGPGVTVVEAGENLGYSRALARGAELLRLAQGVEVEYIWFLNNDLQVDAVALRELISASKRNGSTGLLGCTICRDTSFSEISAVGVRYHPATTRRVALLRGRPVAEYRELRAGTRIDYIPGSAMFMRYSTYVQAGGFSDAYFLYYEELELAAGVRRIGLEVEWCPTALVAHEGGASTGGLRGQRKAPFVGFHAMRSAIIFTRRHHPWLLPSVVFWRGAIHILGRCLVGDWQFARSALNGLISGLRFSARSGSWPYS